MSTGAIGPGAVLGGRYRLDDLLSESGEARFWRGTDTVLGRSVAIHAVAADDRRAEALLAAARASATVVEPHLLRVLDCDDRDGVLWVVNEWGEGTSLDLLLQAGPLAPARAARLAREVAEAVAAAHRHGVAHGRLNPEAVLLTDSGAVKLIGFAVTAALDADDRAAERARALGFADPTPFTQDVIDLAGVLYAGLTGRWPGISPSSVPDAPVDGRGPLRPRQVRAGVPRMLDAICERVLRREAHEHLLPLESAEELLAALTDHGGEESLETLAEEVPPRSAPRPPPRAVPEPPAAGPSGPPAEATAVLRLPADPDATQAALPVVDESPPPPVLPPYRDSPERPLFASGERRPAPPPTRGSAAWLYGGGDTGALPAVLDEPVHRPHLLRWFAVLGAVLVVVAMVVAFQLGHDGGSTGRQPTAGSSSGGAGSAAPIAPVAVHDFDPDGRPSSENPGEVPLATDGNPATGWTTMTYTRPNLGGLKPGVGLLVDLGSDHDVRSVDLRLTGTPTSVALYATSEGSSTPPTNVTSMRRVADVEADRPVVTLRPGARVRTRFLVVWLTSLPAYGDGYRGQIDELTVRS